MDTWRRKMNRLAIRHETAREPKSVVEEWHFKEGDTVTRIVLRESPEERRRRKEVEKYLSSSRVEV